VESAIFLFTRRVLAFFRVNPAKGFNQPDFFYPERLFWSIVGSTSGKPGETGRGGGAKKIKKNRLVFFLRYLAANDTHSQVICDNCFILLLLSILFGLRVRGLTRSVCLSNSKQLSHNQTLLMTSHFFDFDAVTHSIKDVSVSTRQSLASSEMFRIHG